MQESVWSEHTLMLELMNTLWTGNSFTHMVQDLAFCRVVFVSNGICHCTCAQKKGVPVVGARKNIKSSKEGEGSCHLPKHLKILSDVKSYDTTKTEWEDIVLKYCLPGTWSFIFSIFLPFVSGRARTTSVWVRLFLLQGGGQQVKHSALKARENERDLSALTSSENKLEY